jgi:hypothetical protein
MLTDNAIGASQAGISGTAKEGARSVVVVKMYESIDEDHGHEMFYSSPLADEMSGVKESIGTKALQL